MKDKKESFFYFRYWWLGPIIWIFCIQYYISQFIVARAWPIPFSLFLNTISDLGNTSCHMYGVRDVCSPLHQLMNWSFIVLGLSMISGSVLVYHLLPKNSKTTLGYIMIGLGGLGTIMVGLAPENTISSVHILGAALPFIFTNIALIILGFSLPISRTLRIYSVISGTAAIIALVLFINKIYLGLGIGGMERIVSYPQTIWLVVLGFYLLSKPKLLIDEHRKLSV